MIYSNKLFSEIDNLFNEVFYNFPKEPKPPAAYSLSRNKENKPEAYEIQVALAGFKKEDVTVSWEGNELFIEGDNTKNENVFSKFKTNFSWKIPVADNIDLENLSVDFSEGLLTLKIPIRIPVKNRRYLLGGDTNKLIE